ncbi:acetyl-CoA synthetase [Rubricella aquisinus]|uniref:Acetyl-CoA synthetase n=1 Tax=Rubricella aquisinus TaxID=2028108 RepID=A0A840WQ10_9RHOB|nr:AMP-binding protein [Rubricella aquisinus]MBB5516771.1 acetyl-CoA synthetase [Rubricella aquisinus]
MLPQADTYEALTADFAWDIPARYNIGVDVCDRWAKAEPDRTAIIDMTQGVRNDISYATLRDLSNQFANLLTSLGVAAGDRIGILRPQSVETAAGHIAAWKLGGISMPLFSLFGEEALLSRLSDCGARAVITDAAGAALIAPLRARLPELAHVIVPEEIALGSYATDFAPADTGPDDPAILIYTSGTTGAPKGALHGHRVLLGHLPGVEMSHDLLPQRGDVLWTPADWAWIGGLLDVLMPGLHHGVPVVAARLPKFNAAACRDVIAGAGVRNVFFPPTALRMLKAEGMALPGLRTVACGGEPLGAEMLAWGQEALGVTINEFYGQTECNMVLSSCGALFSPRPGAIGRVVPGHDVAVIDTDEAGEGDIAIRRGSPVMMLEYWNNPEATAAKFRGEWLLTGDRGVAQDGFIRFVGRDDDVITSAGYRIGPAEIEDCLMRHDAVASVGVVGKPDPQRTEIVKAYVILRDGVAPDEATRDALKSHVKSKLAAYEYPREIAFVDSLPMTVTGKIIRKDLRARAAKEAG